MTRPVLIISFILLTTTTYAQSTPSTEVRTEDGRVVILKADGTWEYKKAPLQLPPAAAGNVGKNASEPNSLPPNFEGHDAGALFTQLLDLKKRLVKSEFETTLEYEKRAAIEKQKPLLGNLTVKDAFSLVVAGVQAQYDADSQGMKFSLYVWKNTLAELSRRYAKPKDKNTAYDLSEVNLYNISLEPLGYREGIFFDELNGLELSRGGLTAEIKLSVDEAKRLKTATKAVVLVRFEEPFALERLLDKRQFQVHLIDVYFFDQQTGRILAKLRQANE